jgi:hypothetical protein
MALLSLVFLSVLIGLKYSTMYEYLQSITGTVRSVLAEKIHFHRIRPKISNISYMIILKIRGLTEFSPGTA